MALRIYIKQNNSLKRKMVLNFSYLSLTIGSFLLFWSFYPVISFEIYSRLFFQSKTISPVPVSDIVSSLKEASSVLGSYEIFSNNLKDFTQAKLWFPTKQQEVKNLNTFSVKEYFLSIPKINISRAKVMVGGEDLAKTLVHYLPTTLPGEYGNVAIFGHSTLPQLYNVKDYKTIFTYLPSLEKGDKVIVYLGDMSYEYEVYDMFVVKPDKVSVLEQKYDAAYLTLVTCIPPGTAWNRLVIRARLTKLQS